MHNKDITNIYKYLEKYLPVLNRVLEQNHDTSQRESLEHAFLKNESQLDQKQTYNPTENLASTIWQLCWQGVDTAPPIVQKCITSVRTFHQDRHILIDENNYHNYIELPDFIYEKFQNRILNHAHLSDYIRLALLSKYGGTWVDTTVFLSAPIPETILFQDFFVFKFPHWNTLEEILQNTPSPLFDIKNDKRFLFRSSANWFIHSLKKNPIISGTQELLNAYWKEEDTLIHYFLFHALFSMSVLQSKECMNLFQNIQAVFSVEECHLLQYFLPKEFSQNTFTKICDSTSIHKLTYKYLFNVKEENSFLNYLLSKKI